MIWYEIRVSSVEGMLLDDAAAGSLELARQIVAKFRTMYPTCEWITVTRHSHGQLTELPGMSVRQGMTAAERWAARTPLFKPDYD